MKAMVKHHGRWLGLLLVISVAAFGLLPWLRGLTQQLRQHNIELAHELESIKRDEGGARAALDESEARRLLLPTNRSAVVEAIKYYALSANLSHFTVVLGSPRKPDAGLAVVSDVVVGDLTLIADTGLDTDVVAFLDHLPTLLPGRALLKRVTMKRDVFDGQPSLDGLHVEAVYEWLSNADGVATYER